jgi:hypothetical protein
LSHTYLEKAWWSSEDAQAKIELDSEDAVIDDHARLLLRTKRSAAVRRVVEFQFKVVIPISWRAAVSELALVSELRGLRLRRNGSDNKCRKEDE